MFSKVQAYDDEGYQLLTVRQFLDGLPLYDAVYTQYGPAYYLWEQALHQGLRIPLTHDATRLVTVAVWIGGSAASGLLVWLVTRRGLLTAFGTVLAFFHLAQMTFEPGHPQELCLLAVIGALVVMTWRLVRYGRIGIGPMAAVGVLVALTVLTKINVGLFLAGTVTLGLVASLRQCCATCAI